MLSFCNPLIHSLIIDNFFNTFFSPSQYQIKYSKKDVSDLVMIAIEFSQLLI